MKLFISSIVLLSSFTTFANDKFCAEKKNPLSIKNSVRNIDNLMAFRNQGGIGGGGVCWWHSRFQRNSLYIVKFNPKLNEPTFDQAREIIKKIRNGKEVVLIPGFRNFYEFSSVYANEIQNELESWQRSHGARGGWITGLRGKHIVSADKMQLIMDELYQEVKVFGKIAYQKLQIKGITAHAWLVIDMKKTNNGYQLEVLDSNHPYMTKIYNYTLGQTNFYHQSYGAFTPYLEEKDEQQRLQNVILNYCS
jgi:hypothetical protein